MSKTITQTVTFPGAKASDLYALYMNSKKHGDATGGPADIGKEVGEEWSAMGDVLSGKHLHIVRNKTVVQTWRAKDWGKRTPDSILVLSFVDVEDGACVQMVHTLVPDDAYADIKKGWGTYYWSKWKAYLKKRAAK